MNKIDKRSSLTKEIFKTTVEIQKKFPELYELLDETPLFFFFYRKKYQHFRFEAIPRIINNATKIL